MNFFKKFTAKLNVKKLLSFFKFLSKGNAGEKIEQEVKEEIEEAKKELGK